MQTRRERMRQMAFDEIKTFSWEIVAERGIDDLTVNEIAKKMGVTPPAFYRYFKSRDELIKSLVLDAYDSFGKALKSARDSLPEEETTQKLYAVFIAYREWAVENSNMFGLFAGKKVYGFRNYDPKVIAESKKIYSIFIELYRTAWNKGLLKKPEMNMGFPDSYIKHIQNNLAGLFRDIPIEIINLVLNSACLIHGMISMELSDRLSLMTGDPELFYKYQILDMLHRFGIEHQP